MLILISPVAAEAYGYYYMKINRKRANQVAERIYVSETEEAPHAYEEIKELEKKAHTPEACVKRLKRQAVREEGDGILGLKYQGFEKSDQLLCKGKLVRWKPAAESQATSENEKTGAANASP